MLPGHVNPTQVQVERHASVSFHSTGSQLQSVACPLEVRPASSDIEKTVNERTVTLVLVLPAATILRAYKKTMFMVG